MQKDCQRNKHETGTLICNQIYVEIAGIYMEKSFTHELLDLPEKITLAYGNNATFYKHLNTNPCEAKVGGGNLQN